MLSKLETNCCLTTSAAEGKNVARSETPHTMMGQKIKKNKNHTFLLVASCRLLDPNVINHTNECTLSDSLSSQGFMVLHSVVYTKRVWRMERRKKKKSLEKSAPSYVLASRKSGQYRLIVGFGKVTLHLHVFWPAGRKLNTKRNPAHTRGEHVHTERPRPGGGFHPRNLSLC